MPGYFPQHRVGHHVAHLGLVQPGRVAQDVVGLRADHLVAQHRGLRVGVVDDRLDVGHGPRRRASWRPGSPRRPTPRRRRCTISWSTEYDAPALMPSVTRMSPRIRFDTRWVWPTTIASTVVSWSASAMSRIGPSHAAPGVLPTGLLPSAVPWWMTTTWTLTPCRRSRSDSALIRGRLVEERQPLGGAGRDELRRLLEPCADHADLHAVDLEHLRRRHPVRCLSGVRVDDVGRQEREVGPRLLLQQPGDAVVELVVAVRRGVQAPGVLHVDRRRVLEQRRVRRRGADVVAAGQDQALSRQARRGPRRTSSRGRPRRPPGR